LFRSWLAGSQLQKGACWPREDANQKAVAEATVLFRVSEATPGKFRYRILKRSASSQCVEPSRCLPGWIVGAPSARDLRRASPRRRASSKWRMSPSRTANPQQNSGGRHHRRRLWREEPASPRPAQTVAANTTGEMRTVTSNFRIPKLRKGSCFPGFPRTAPHGREGADCRHPGCLRPRHLDALGRGPVRTFA
jgi:hypothetical protein